MAIAIFCSLTFFQLNWLFSVACGSVTLYNESIRDSMGPDSSRCVLEVSPCCVKNIPYPGSVYTGWSNVPWKATGMPLVDPVYTGITLGDLANTAGYTKTPLEKLSWNCPTLECHWRNTIGGTVTSTCTQAQIVKQSSIHASLKWQDGGTSSSKWTGLCKFTFYLEFTALQWISVISSNVWVPRHHSVHALDMSTIIVFVYLGLQFKWNQLSSNNSWTLATPVVYIKGCMLGSGLPWWPPNQILSVHWDTTGQTTLEPDWLMLSPSGLPVAVQRGATCTLGCHWNHTGWC